MLFEIRGAKHSDLPLLAAHEHHISAEALAKCVSDSRVLMAFSGNTFAGWLRWNLFWDSVPFMNMLYILERHRGQGAGRALTEHWEDLMRAEKHPTVLTSTASDEYAQHFYTRLGYKAIGGFTPCGDPLELIFEKVL